MHVSRGRPYDGHAQTSRRWRDPSLQVPLDYREPLIHSLPPDVTRAPFEEADAEGGPPPDQTDASWMGWTRDSGRVP